MDATGKRYTEMGSKSRMEVGFVTRILPIYVSWLRCEARRHMHIIMRHKFMFISMRKKLRLTGVDNWPLNWQFRGCSRYVGIVINKSRRVIVTAATELGTLT